MIFSTPAFLFEGLEQSRLTTKYDIGLVDTADMQLVTAFCN